VDSQDQAAGQAVPQTEETMIRRAIVGASVGNCVEWFDFAVYGFLATTLGAVFFPSEVSLPGGGGFGVAIEREPERVARDVSEGLVSVERAREIYRVVLTRADGRYAVDAEATDRLRAAPGSEGNGP
jgi:hypothetical protein